MKKITEKLQKIGTMTSFASKAANKKMLEALDLKAEDTVYFEHDAVAVENAKSLGINSYFYDSEKKDVESLASFLKVNL